VVAPDSKNPVKFRQIYIILHITYVEMASEPIVHVWKYSLSQSERERENFGMDNASFTFGVNFRMIWSIASHANTLPFARFTRMCLYRSAHEIYIFSISISCIWKELFTKQRHWRMGGIIFACYFPYRCCRGNSGGKLFKF